MFDRRFAAPAMAWMDTVQASTQVDGSTRTEVLVVSEVGSADVRLSRVSEHMVAMRGAMRPRYSAAHVFAHLVPGFAGGTLIAGLYRLGGLSVGDGSVIGGPLTLRGGHEIGRRLRIGRDVVMASDVTINLDGEVVIEDKCSIGPFVRIYTGTHGIGPGSRRMLPVVTPKPVRIGAGSWLGLGTTVLPGVEVGPGCVVAAGSVVADDIEPHTYAAGNPAVAVRPLPWSDR